MQNFTNSETIEEPNYFLRQAAALDADEADEDAAFLFEERATKAPLDIGWGITLAVWWVLWVLVIYWKTAPGNLAAVPTFLILLAAGTTVTITAWIDSRSDTGIAAQFMNSMKRR